MKEIEDAGDRGLISQIEESVGTEIAGNPATRRRSAESAGNPKSARIPAMRRRPTKSAGNPAIQRRSTTREIEGSTELDRDRRTIDPGLNDAIEEVDNSRQ